MFDRLKKNIYSLGVSEASGLFHKDGSGRNDRVSQWASSRGFSYLGGQGINFTMRGKVVGKSWKLECGPSSRDYIAGNELRARAELGIPQDIAMLLMNRPLKQSLEKRVYEMYTDTLQTRVGPDMPEELRWLSMFPEVGWGTAPPELWERYSVLAEHREQAMNWITPSVTDLLLSWPEPGPDDHLPFVLMLLRGKAYLRMQHLPHNIEVLDHAALIFTATCESASGGLSMDISI